MFALLAERGFPAQKQKPHITVTFSPDMADHVVQRAAELLPPVIPASLKRVGSVVFGTKRKQTVVWYSKPQMNWRSMLARSVRRSKARGWNAQQRDFASELLRQENYLIAQTVARAGLRDPSRSDASR